MISIIGWVADSAGVIPAKVEDTRSVAIPGIPPEAVHGQAEWRGKGEGRSESGLCRLKKDDLIEEGFGLLSQPVQRQCIDGLAQAHPLI